jgi:hypothetical protein
MKSTSSFVFTLTQLVADTDVSRVIQTTLLNDQPQVLKILGIEVYWDNSASIPAVSCLLTLKFFFGNRSAAEIKHTLYFRSDAAGTGKSVMTNTLWIPPITVDILCPHESLTATLLSTGTTILNSATFRMWYEKIPVSTTDKLAMLAIK